jgi:hypothetical protein
MTSNAKRADVLARALRAGIGNDGEPDAELYTEDVRAWTPALATTSRKELLAEFDRRDDAFSDIELDVIPLDVGGEYACAEWTVAMTHSGPLPIAPGTVIEPTGTRVTLHGVTVAEFRGEQICSLRQYWDEFSVVEQLGLLPGEPQ